MDQQQWNGKYITAPGMAVIDPVQSTLYNCSLIAAMASCAWTGKGAWYKDVGTNDQAVAMSYNLQFYDYNKPVPPVSPSSKLPQNPPGTLVYGKSSTANECWPGIIEKGYYMSRDRILRNIDNDNPDMEYYNVDNPTNDPPTVLYHLLSVNPEKRTKTLYGTDYKEGMIWANLKQICMGRVPNQKIRYPAVAYTFDQRQNDWTTDTISPKHTYSILGLVDNITIPPKDPLSKYIVLRDPRGAGGEASLPSPYMLTTGAWLSGIDFANKDGIFAIRSDVFPVYFQGYAYSIC